MPPYISVEWGELCRLRSLIIRRELGKRQPIAPVGVVRLGSHPGTLGCGGLEQGHGVGEMARESSV